MSHMIYRTTPP